MEGRGERPKDCGRLNQSSEMKLALVVVAEQRSILSIPSAPAILTCVHATLGKEGGGSSPLDHQDNIAPSGY
eukprot:11216102-Karenia_brevis.AAC.1